MRRRRSVLRRSGALVKLTKIKIILGQSRNALVGSVYSQVLTAAVRLTRIAKPGTGNVQGGLHEATLACQTAPGTLNWTESGTHTGTGCTYEGSGQLAVGPNPLPRRVQGFHYGNITWTCKGIPRPSVDRLYPGWFDFAGSLYSNGSEFVPGVHTEAVRDDGTLAGVHSLEGIEGGGHLARLAALGRRIRGRPTAPS